jgi:hydrogenase maturation protease
MNILIVGLGNPILGDDGIGWHVAEEVSRRLGIPLGDALSPPGPESVTIERYSLAGLSLMERLSGCDAVILIDSLNTARYPQGEIIHFTLADMDDLTYGHSASAHDVSLKNALALGRRLGEALPADDQIHIIAIEAQHVYDFQEELSPGMARVVPVAAQKVIELLDEITANPSTSRPARETSKLNTTGFYSPAPC